MTIVVNEHYPRGIRAAVWYTPLDRHLSGDMDHSHERFPATSSEDSTYDSTQVILRPWAL